MTFEPNAKRRKARFFNECRFCAHWRNRVATPQEVDESTRASSATCESRALDHFAALALYGAAAIVLGEAFDYGVVHIAPQNTRQTKPHSEMLRL
ncbi:MAG TPA: hypothetical protein VIF61_04255 [Methylocystis sp.]|jgi:hypothetical protein